MTKKYMWMTLAVATGLASCKKEYDMPPLPTVPTGNVITLDSLRNMFQGSPVHFTGQDMSVYGVITADEVDGNLYKNVYMQSGSAAINVRLLNSGGIYIGDSIRIYLKGTVLSKYNGVLQLDSVDVDKNVVKQASGIVVAPLDIDLTDLNTSLQSRLVRINNVEFETAELGKTFADGTNQVTENRLIADCAGHTALVRTSGFANYANQVLPTGKGSIVVVVSEFNGDLQLYIRKLSEVNMTGPRCPAPYLSKNFEDNNIISGGWSMQNVTGAVNWSTNSIGASSGEYYAQCSNYISGSNQACDTWFISPSVDLSASTNPALSFINAYKYTGAPMQLYISTDYVSGLPATGTWAPLTGWTLSPGSFTWVSSGYVNLSAYKTNNVHIAFRYTGSSSDGSTWEIDDIKISEQ